MAGSIKAIAVRDNPAENRRICDHAIDEFVRWYCSEPRLAFNRTVVLRYRIHDRVWTSARRTLVAHVGVDPAARDEHWVIADLNGKAGHIRTVPIPSWVKAAIDVWTAHAGITEGRVFRAINKAGNVWGDGMCVA